MLSLLLMTWLNLVPAGIQAEEPAVPERIPLEEILTRREESDFYRKTRYKDKIEVLRKVMERRSDHLEDELEERNLAVIFRTLAELRSVSTVILELSLNETDENERRDKEVKRLEIDLRKLSEQLGNQMLSVPFENRTQFEETITIVEAVRDQLLQQLFGKAIGALALPGPGRMTGAVHGLVPALAPAAASLQRGLWDLDKFTEKEYEKVQYARKLVKRVEVFLEIAQARLDEIERREAGREWEEEEPNPLEFFTYEDMLFGYYRAVEGIMVNIDEKARSGSEEEKEIRKALEKLKEKIDEFLPRLEAFEEMVRSSKDVALYKQWREATRSSEIARKGALYGLGAPEE